MTKNVTRILSISILATKACGRGGKGGGSVHVVVIPGTTVLQTVFIVLSAFVGLILLIGIIWFVMAKHERPKYKPEEVQLMSHHKTD